MHIRKKAVYLFSGMNDTAMIQIEGMTLQFGDTPLLDGLDMQVDAGEMVCLTGESGCGKTSLLRAMLGFVPMFAGRVTVDGCVLEAGTVSYIRSRVDYVPQELSLPCERVADLVEMVAGLKTNRRWSYASERLFAVWEKLALDQGLYTQRWAKVSGGQRQRILLSLAALTDKPLLLADEPTAALDEENAHRVGLLLRDLCGRGRTVLVVSHDERLMEACDRVIRI